MNIKQVDLANIFLFPKKQKQTEEHPTISRRKEEINK
jgi:hypothetical protein